MTPRMCLNEKVFRRFFLHKLHLNFVAKEKAIVMMYKKKKNCFLTSFCDFHIGRILAWQECGSLYCITTSCVGRDHITAKRI